MANGVNEFGLIDDITQALGDSATAPWVHVGIGDDAAVMRPRPGFDAVAFIDTGSRCTFHVRATGPDTSSAYSAFGSAAMAALPRYALVALTCRNGSPISLQWVQQLAQGMAVAAEETGTALCGRQSNSGRLIH